MNCKRIEKLLPLYLEGDLEASLGDIVRPHLKACKKCREISDKLGAAQAWLRCYKAPDLSGAFFDEARHAVWLKIEALEASGTPFRSLARHLGGNAAVAASLFLLCMLGAIALHYARTNSGSNGGRLIARITPGAHADAAETMIGTEKRDANRVAAQETARRERRAPSWSVKRQAGAIGRAKPVLELSVDQADDPQPAAKGQLEQEESQGQGIAAQLKRVDIDTGDPTIRIIWFSPAEEDLTSESDADES